MGPRTSLLGLLLLLSAGLAWAGTAEAILIQTVYDPGADGIDPCTFVIDEHGAIGHYPACQGDVDRTPDLTLHIGVAAAQWEHIFKDDHIVTVRYRWVVNQSPSANVTAIDAQNRPTEGIVRIPADLVWYYDPDPIDDDEFAMTSKLYRTLHPDERAEAVIGTPPEVFEVGYNGTNPALPLDLLTTALHEIGHILGLEGDVWSAAPAACAETATDAHYSIDPVLVGGATVALKAYEFLDGGQQAFDCSHLALGGITACKTDPEQDPLSTEPSTLPGLTVRECTSHQSLFWFAIYPRSRQRPDTAGILAIARAAGWQEIDLPRKFSLGSGLWEEPATWLGNRVPDAGDDVFIVNQDASATVTLFEPGVARNLTLSGDNALGLFFAPLHVGDTVRVAGDGASLTVDTSATLEASRVEVGAGGLLDVAYNGSADIFQLRNHGIIRGGGSITTALLVNDGTIRGNGDTPLAFTTADPDLTLDLDGTQGAAVIEALVGDLVFDGKIANAVAAAIDVGGARSITFSQGWQQASSFSPTHRLKLNNGSAFEAVVHGSTALGGTIEPDGVGRFTGNVVLESTARLLMDIGGLTPGSGHDQIRFGQSAQLGGHLGVSLLPGYQPSPGDTFTVLTSGSMTGVFDTFTATVIPGGLQFVPTYGATDVTLVVGFQGGTPGAPNCKGNATEQQVSVHGSLKKAAEFHGLTVKQLQDAIKTFCNA